MACYISVFPEDVIEMELACQLITQLLQITATFVNPALAVLVRDVSFIYFTAVSAHEKMRTIYINCSHQLKCLNWCVSHTSIYLWRPATISKLTAINRFSKRLWLRWINMSTARFKIKTAVFISLYFWRKPTVFRKFWMSFSFHLACNVW